MEAVLTTMPRPPSGVTGSSPAIAAADLAVIKYVPTRLTAITWRNSAKSCARSSPVSRFLVHRAPDRRDAGAVDQDALDAMRATRLLKRSFDGSLIGDVRSAEQTADRVGARLAAVFVLVEDRHPDALGGQHPRRRRAEAGRAACHKSRRGIVKPHRSPSSMTTGRQGRTRILPFAS